MLPVISGAPTLAAANRMGVVIGNYPPDRAVRFFAGHQPAARHRRKGVAGDAEGHRRVVVEPPASHNDVADHGCHGIAGVDSVEQTEIGCAGTQSLRERPNHLRSLKQCGVAPLRERRHRRRDSCVNVGRPAAGTRAMVEPSCGAVISIAAPSAALTRSPPMSIRQSRSSSLATSVLLLSREDCTCYAHFLEDHSSA